MKQRHERSLPFEVWALVAGGFTIALGYGVVAPVLPQFAREFDVSNFAASAIISAFALTRLVFAPAAGLIVAKLGERATYVVGILIVAVMTGVAVFVTEYSQLLASRAIAGVGSTMFTIAATALLIKVTPVTQRGRVAGINAAGFLLGNLIGPVLGAVVAGFGIRAPFVVYFFALVAAAAVVWFSLGGRASARAASSTEAPTPLGLREAFAVPQYRSALFSTFAFGWASFGVRVSAVPLFVAAVLFGSESDAGWVLAAYAAGNAALVIPSGRWNDRIGRRPLMIVGYALGALAFVALPFTTALWAAMAALLVAGAGSALSNPAQQAVIADVVGRRNGGQVVAVAQMAADLGAILGPLAAGLIIDSVGFSAAFWMTAGLLVLASFVWTVTPDSRRLIGSEGDQPLPPKTAGTA